MRSDSKTIGEVLAAVGFEQAKALAAGLSEREDRLVLRDHALHLVTEAHRVVKMKGATLEEWGRLMGESRESCLHS
jgi:N-acetylgalactosamine kinase